MHQVPSLEEMFFGSATIGERGQIVIPADARKECGIHSGDKLLVFRHPLHPRMLILAKVGEMQEMLKQMKQMTNVLEQANLKFFEAVSSEEE